MLLIADDDVHLRKGLVDLFRREGLSSRALGNGADALAAFRDRRPRICLLDVMMPGLDGLALCREIRRVDKRVPILLLSARDAEMDRVLGLEIGADDYIVKPFGPRELVARVRAALRRMESEPSSQGFVMRDLTVDASALRAFRNGRSIDLTRREIVILQSLFERQGKPVSRDELLDLAWGRDFMPDSRALDQYISALRRKVETNPAAPAIIKTVHGVGYRYDRDD